MSGWQLINPASDFFHEKLTELLVVTVLIFALSFSRSILSFYTGFQWKICIDTSTAANSKWYRWGIDQLQEANTRSMSPEIWDLSVGNRIESIRTFSSRKRFIMNKIKWNVQRHYLRTTAFRGYSVKQYSLKACFTKYVSLLLACI